MVTISDWLPVIVARLVREFGPLQVILFGSQATGEARLDSDINLLVVLTTAWPQTQYGGGYAPAPERRAYTG